MTARRALDQLAQAGDIVRRRGSGSFVADDSVRSSYLVVRNIYKGRDDFNNPLVITIGMAALWLSLSGFILLFRSFRRQDFAFLTAWRRASPEAGKSP